MFNAFNINLRDINRTAISFAEIKQAKLLCSNYTLVKYMLRVEHLGIKL